MKQTAIMEKAPGGQNHEMILYKELGYQVQGALQRVYNTLGPGFREETYRRALMRELAKPGIAFEKERAIDIRFDGEVIDQYRLDLVVDSRIVVELKAVDELRPMHEAQLLSYLRASGLRLGLLVNFGADKLQIRRKVM